MAKRRISNLKEDMAIMLVKGLCEGKSEREMHEYFVANGIKPSSLESIDLYMKELRERNRCRTTFQLMYELGRGMKLKVN